MSLLNNCFDSMDNYRVIVEHISVDNGFKVNIYKKCFQVCYCGKVLLALYTWCF